MSALNPSLNPSGTTNIDILPEEVLEDIGIEIKEALENLIEVVQLLDDDDEDDTSMKKEDGFTMTDYLKNRKDLTDAMEEIADKIDIVMRRTGTTRAASGGVGIAGGLAIFGGILLAPFTGGASALLTIGGTAMTTAGTLTEMTADIVKEAQLEELKGRVNETFEKLEKKEKVMTDMFQNIEKSLESIVRSEDKVINVLKELKERIADEEELELTKTKQVKRGIKKVMKAFRYFNHARATAGPEYMKEVAKRISAPGATLSNKHLKGIIEKIGGKKLFISGSSTAKAFNAVFTIFGIGTNIAGVAEAAKDVKRSRTSTTELRKMRRDYIENTVIIESWTYLAQCAVKGNEVDKKKLERLMNGINWDVRQINLKSGDSIVHVHELEWVQVDKDFIKRLTFTHVKRDAWLIHLQDNRNKSGVLEVNMENDKVSWLNNDTKVVSTIESVDVIVTSGDVEVNGTNVKRVYLVDDSYFVNYRKKKWALVDYEGTSHATFTEEEREDGSVTLNSDELLEANFDATEVDQEQEQPVKKHKRKMLVVLDLQKTKVFWYYDANSFGRNPGKKGDVIHEVEIGTDEIDGKMVKRISKI